MYGSLLIFMAKNYYLLVILNVLQFLLTSGFALTYFLYLTKFLFTNRLVEVAGISIYYFLLL